MIKGLNGKSLGWYLSVIPFMIILLFILIAGIIAGNGLWDIASFDDNKAIRSCACITSFNQGTELHVDFMFEDSSLVQHNFSEHITAEELKQLQKHFCFKVDYMPNNPSSNRIRFNQPCEGYLPKPQGR